MKNKAEKFVSLVMAFIMALSLSVPAMAEEDAYTRGSFAQALVNWSGLTSSTMTYPSDCEESEYKEAVAVVLANGLMATVIDGNFYPDSFVTRAEAAAILWRYAGQPIVEAELPDGLTGDEWYAEAARYVVAQGIMTPSGSADFWTGNTYEGDVYWYQVPRVVYDESGTGGGTNVSTGGGPVVSTGGGSSGGGSTSVVVEYDTITVDGTSFQSNESTSGDGWRYEGNEWGYGTLYLSGYNGGAISSTGSLNISVEPQTENTVTSSAGNAISAKNAVDIYGGWKASLSVNGAEDGVYSESVSLYASSGSSLSVHGTKYGVYYGTHCNLDGGGIVITGDTAATGCGVGASFYFNEETYNTKIQLKQDKIQEREVIL